LRISELPVPLIYLEEERSFGGALDDAARRIAYYRTVLDRSLAAVEAEEGSKLPRPKAAPRPEGAERC
jgi:dolichol-phosphate mannosyltransferase